MLEDLDRVSGINTRMCCTSIVTLYFVLCSVDVIQNLYIVHFRDRQINTYNNKGQTATVCSELEFSFTSNNNRKVLLLVLTH